ncbi:MAG: helix-turn-helix transcriptional regulator [Saprospiraceae bacterium]
MITHYQEFELYGIKTFVKALMQPPYRFIYTMPNEACFFYIVNGDTKVSFADETYPLQAQEGLVMHCGNYLAEILPSSTGSEAIAIHLHQEVLRTIYDKEFPDFLVNVNNIKPIKCEKRKADHLMQNYINSLQFYFNNPELVSEELLKLKLKELILLLAKTDNAEAVLSLLSGLFSTTEIDFKSVIEANLYRNLTLEELSQLTNLSLSSFKREFARQYNNSPARFIRQRRLEKAAKMLKASDLRVTDVAYDCGFTDLAHFSKTFQKTYGLSPSEYRN